MKKTELEKVYALRMRFLYFSHKDNFAYFYIRNLSNRILNLPLQNHVYGISHRTPASYPSSQTFPLHTARLIDSVLTPLFHSPKVWPGTFR